MYRRVREVLVQMRPWGRDQAYVASLRQCSGWGWPRFVRCSYVFILMIWPLCPIGVYKCIAIVIGGLSKPYFGGLPMSKMSK